MTTNTMNPTMSAPADERVLVGVPRQIVEAIDFSVRLGLLKAGDDHVTIALCRYFGERLTQVIDAEHARRAALKGT